jgi:hypothetical protein
MKPLDLQGQPSQWDAYAEQLRVKLPAAPEALLAGYVRWMPWVALVFGVLSVVLLLFFGLLGVVMAPVLAVFGGAAGIHGVADFFFVVVVGLILSGLDVAGGWMMRQRRLTGWWLLAIGLVIGAISDVLHLALFSLLVTLVIAYIHLQVKPRYS